MPLHTIEPRRLYRQIADQLRALIKAGEYPVGQRLPAERELAARLGVSRPSVREALIALEVEGLVEVRMGSGIHVLARERAASAPRVEAAFGPFETIRARQVLEGELAALAAQNSTPALLQALDEALALMTDDVAQGLAPIRGDRLFHTTIAQAADNGPLLRCAAELFDQRHTPLFEQLGQHFETPPTWRLALAEHQAVRQAVAQGDAQAARAAMQHHLQQSHDRLAGSWPQAPCSTPAPHAPCERPTAPAAARPAGRRRAATPTRSIAASAQRPAPNTATRTTSAAATPSDHPVPPQPQDPTP